MTGDVENALPGLGLIRVSSGFLDNDGVAGGTIDPADTGADVAAQGRLDGFSSEFRNTTGDFSVSAGTDLFQTEALAQAYLGLQVQDFQRLEGTVIQEAVEGQSPEVILSQFRQVAPPNVGQDAISGELTFSFTGLDFTLTNTFVSWHRRNVVATVVVGAFDQEDRTAATNQLAQRMDELILAALP